MIAGSGSPSLATSLTLRCSGCGAPYSDTEGRQTLVCTFCGSEQRLVDARQFLDHLTVQVQSFLRQALPIGVDPAGQGIIDPVARNAIFASNVAPWLSVESTGLKFRFLQLASQPLLVLPFSVARTLVTQDQATSVALFGAKVQGVSGLAASDPNRQSLDQSTRLGTAYAASLVAASLLRESKSERFHLAAANFETAARELKATDRLGALSGRFTGLAHASRGLDAIRDGKFVDARESLMQALQSLQAAKEELRGRLDLAFTASAIDRELSISRAAVSLADAGDQAKRAGHPRPIEALTAFNSALDYSAVNAPSSWSGGFSSEITREELSRRFLELRQAKNGAATARSLPIGSGLLIPYWIVQLSYTFETGALWKKQAKNVPDLLLVAATFPFESRALGLQLPSASISDVFRASGRPAGLSGFANRLSGSEQSLSQSAAIHQIYQNSVVQSLPGTPAVPPLAGGAQAVALCEHYLSQLRLQSPKVTEQFKSKALSALDIVYIPTDVRPGAIPLAWLGQISPMSVGEPQAILGLAS